VTQENVGDSSEIVIATRDLGKAYYLYRRPEDRVKQILFGRQKIYREEFWALRDVNFELRRGETLGVLGMNGAGKSTLLQLICGTLQPTVGTVTVAGRIAAMLGLGAGFHPQFTGRENVRLKAAALGLGKREIQDRMDSIAEFAGIGEFLDLPVRQYSSGMYARLAFAVCAHVDADILIVDEILAVGDAEFRQKCSRFLNRFRERGTVLFVSHSTGTVTELCEKALWLDHGRVREIGPAEEVGARYLASMSEEDGSTPLFHSEASADRSWAPPPAPLLSDFRRPRPDRITISEFDSSAPFHGYGGAVIDDVAFHAPGQGRLSEMSGGEEVELRICGHATREVSQPIVGFILRDRFGQAVFGDNTYIHCRESLPVIGAGDRFEGIFRFQMPWLACGNYSVTAAFVDGTQDDHTHLYWIEDSLAISVDESRVARGIVALPSTDIGIRVANVTGHQE
jgi:lipopolysaccharide transport system ATP-binding protein